MIAEWDQTKKTVIQTVADYSTIVRLGQGVDQSRELAPEAILRTLTCLKGYAEKVQASGLRCEEAVCVATSQARDAKNGAIFFDRIQSETGFKFRTISGDQEAQLTFIGGLLPGMDPDKSAVMDIGGGSTERMGSQGGLSLDVGSVRFTERYLKSNPVTDDDFWGCQEAIDALLCSAKAWRARYSKDLQLVAVAGTATTLAAWHLELPEFDAEKINQAVLTRGDVHRMVEELKWRTIEERKKLPGIDEGRADVLLAGGLILWRAMEVLDFTDCRISTRGLRYGALSL